MTRKSLVITAKTEKDMLFLKTLLKKLGYSTWELTEEDIENTDLLYAMVSQKKEDYVSEEEILDALR